MESHENAHYFTGSAAKLVGYINKYFSTGIGDYDIPSPEWFVFSTQQRRNQVPMEFKIEAKIDNHTISAPLYGFHPMVGSIVLKVGNGEVSNLVSVPHHTEIFCSIAPKK